MKITKKDVLKYYAVYNYRFFYKMHDFKTVERLTGLSVEKIKIIYVYFPKLKKLIDTNNFKKKLVRQIIS